MKSESTDYPAKGLHLPPEKARKTPERKFGPARGRNQKLTVNLPPSSLSRFTVMKSLFRSPHLSLLSLCCLLGMLACSDPCDKVDCGEFGSCSEVQDEPNCICAAGYEQDGTNRCNRRTTTKFTGDWTAQERRTNNLTQVRTTLTYPLTITDEAAQITRIYFANLGEFTCAGDAPLVEATVSRNFLFLDEATYCPAPGFSGYQFDRTNGEIRTTQDTIKLTFRVRWTDQGTPADFSSELTLYRP